MSSRESAHTVDRSPESAGGRPPNHVDPEVLEKEHSTWTWKKILVWVLIALVGGFSWVMVALVRGETVNGIWFVFAAVCSYFIAYRFYSKYIENKLLKPNDRRATPAMAAKW